MLLVLIAFSYTGFLEEKKDSLQNIKYKLLASEMQEEVGAMILAKQKATLAMAISLANDKKLVQDVFSNNIDNDYYKKLISDYREYTQYKNIWVHIIDKDLNSIYKSWSNIKHENIAGLRPDLVSVSKSKKPSYGCSAGLYDLSIKAVIPLFKDDVFIGIIEVISHFNSISKQLKKFDTDSVVVLKKRYSEKLKYPFTATFINSEYYVANFDAPSGILKYLEKKGVQNYFNNSYKVEDDYLVVSHELKTLNMESLGYYIMFKKRNNVSNLDLDFLMFKWFTFTTIIVMSIAIIVSSFLFYGNRREKKYYKNIIDSSTNIVVINDKNTTIDVNRVFFKYFDGYKSLKEFKMEHACICDFFVKEDGCVQKDMSGQHWVEYLEQNSTSYNKVKIKYNEKEYYFSVAVSLISVEKNHYSVVLTDITEQERYKIELEYLTVTDPLTGIKNRRYFNQRLKEEISKSRRYGHSLSLIMCDIDFFKKVNDIHGHIVGDNVLVEYSKLISSFIRNVDIFCRIGGEEFMIILPHASKENAEVIAEKLRIEIKNSEKILPITMSFGVTQYVDGEDAEFLYKRVDDALYKAKETGRDRVVVG
ncbi:diguanylate cyclase [Candidatus Sulfurimonas marisnigri]|uniref:diguanylate cyclase n=1 Tax=Candidatus Sulfurimonas marisnigri TaxID=2740405 RepID=A0A7S7M325_9BACT|nr:diguanylate cyclase [Candidatus Sulfurimonas marisnigri]